MPNTAAQEASRANAQKAWTSSQRIRNVRTVIKRIENCPPLTREQRQAVIEAAIGLPVLEDQK